MPPARLEGSGARHARHIIAEHTKWVKAHLRMASASSGPLLTIIVQDKNALYVDLYASPISLAASLFFIYSLHVLLNIRSARNTSFHSFLLLYMTCLHDRASF